MATEQRDIRKRWITDEPMFVNQIKFLVEERWHDDYPEDFTETVIDGIRRMPPAYYWYIAVANGDVEIPDVTWQDYYKTQKGDEFVYKLRTEVVNEITSRDKVEDIRIWALKNIRPRSH